jgi:hypothetical protein
MEPIGAHLIPNSEAPDVFGNLVDDSHNLMSQNERRFLQGKVSLSDMIISSADAASQDLNSYFVVLGIGCRNLHQF